VFYNATTAGKFEINIQFDDDMTTNSLVSLASLVPTPIMGSPYTIFVYASTIDPEKTILSNLTGTDQGTFYLQVRDRYGNDETKLSASFFMVDLSPFCAESNITTTPIGGVLKCDYTVQEGGIYCIVIDYLGVKIPIENSTIRATGGLGCSGSCSQQGYCFKNTSTNTFSCNCFQGLIGENCETKRSSKYPLAIGAVVGLIVGLAVLLFIIGLLLGYFVLARLRNRGGDDHKPLLSAD